MTTIVYAKKFRLHDQGRKKLAQFRQWKQP
jgi:hypothetical protein